MEVSVKYLTILSILMLTACGSAPPFFNSGHTQDDADWACDVAVRAIYGVKSTGIPWGEETYEGHYRTYQYSYVGDDKYKHICYYEPSGKMESIKTYANGLPHDEIRDERVHNFLLKRK